MAKSPAQPLTVEKRLRTVRITMIVQVVLNIVGSAFILYLLALAEDNGDDTTGFGLLRGLSVASAILAVVLLVCAVRLLRKQPWVRVTTLVIEGVIVATGLVNLVSSLSSGSPSALAILPVVLGISVIAPLLRGDVRDWFDDWAMPAA